MAMLVVDSDDAGRTERYRWYRAWDGVGEGWLSDLGWDLEGDSS